jgi:hypothetical protein
MPESSACSRSGPRSSGWKWAVVYLVVLGGVGAALAAMHQWLPIGGVALLAIWAAVGLRHADRDEQERFRGHCRHCGHEIFAEDRECPGCERTVPREQREPSRA